MFGLIPFRTNKNDEKGVTFNDFFNDFFNDDFFAPANFSDSSMNKFNADVRETDKEYLVSAELPGVKKEDIALDYKDNYLVIRAKREEIHDESKDSYIRKERSYGEFSRQFYFDNVDKDKICAKFQNGELQIILPKREQKIDNSTKIFIQ